MSDLRAALRAKYASEYASGRLGPLGREAARATDQAATDRAEPDGLDEPGAFWTPERAFVVRGSAGRTVITAPLREVARANSGFTYLRGRFVEADTPNRNGAMWTTADLQLGVPTVAGGPLNWLHQEHKIIGTLLSGDLVTGTPGGPETAADQPVGNHIVSDAAMWRFLYPNETAAVEHAAAAGEAFYCVDPETEMLTLTGWKRYEDLEVGELVYTCDAETGLARWRPLRAVNVFDYDADLISFEGQQHSSLTTPNHRWFVRQGSGDAAHTEWRTSDRLTQTSGIPRAVPAGEPPPGKYQDAFVELVAWFWTEGTITRDSGGVSISQSHAHNPQQTQRLTATLQALFGDPAPARDGGRWHWRRYGRMTRFELCTAVAEELRAVAPRGVVAAGFLAELTQAQLRLFIDTSIDADGTRAKTDGQVSITQSSQQRIRAFEVACALAGIPTNTTQVNTGWSGLARRWRERLGRSVDDAPPAWRCCLVRRSAHVYPKRNAELSARGVSHGSAATLVPYRGKVWCPTTPDGTFLARRRGTVYWTGNSMECIGREVACVDAPGHAGCGETFSYADYDAGRCCAHLRERSSVRRFVDPVFLGGAIIVPPVQPGWAAADVEVMRQAAAVTEQNGLAGELSRPEAEGMVAHILAWANRDLARDYSPGQRKKMAAKGQAQPNGDSGGSFPIRDGHDLRNAIAAFGRAKDKAATKAHIIKRARALGLTKLLPEGWQTSQD